MKLKGTKVLVTGADGFIGSHLVEKLIENGADVRAFVYYNSFNTWGWLDSFSKKKLEAVDIFAGDIRDPNGVAEAMKGVDCVFHLAALIGIPFSYHSPDSYVDTNIKGTLNILQAARHRGVKKIVHTSTSEIYGTAQVVPIDENHPINPQSPYAATKSAADQLALSFYRSFDLPVTVLRPFNTFGPRQSARAIIPTIISQVLVGKKSIKLGNCDVTRDFNYVKNTADAFVTLAESQKGCGEVFNVGTGREVTIHKIVEIIEDVVGHKIKIITDKTRLRPQKSEVERLLCNADALKDATGWKPKVSLEAGIKKTVAWMRDNLKSYKTEIYNV